MIITKNVKITTSGIYLIKNKITDKIYIGSAINIYSRIFGTRTSSHVNSLNKRKHCNKKLQNAWNKYGEENFEFEVLEFCKKENLLSREQYYLNTVVFAQDKIKFAKLAYNICNTAGSPLNRKMPLITKQKLSLLRKGSNNPMFGIKYANNKRSKKIIQYDEQGNFIKIWTCVAIASEQLNLTKSSITNSIYKNQKGGNYYWKNYTDNFTLKIICKKQLKIKLEGINIFNSNKLKFNSIKEASVYFNIPFRVFANGVRNSIISNNKIYKNYTWKYLNK